MGGGRVQRGFSLAVAVAAALSAVACHGPTVHPAAVRSTPHAPTATPTPAAVTPDPTPEPAAAWPDGACSAAQLDMSLSLAPSRLPRGSEFVASWTLGNSAARACDIGPCATELRVIPDTGAGGGVVSMDCFGRTGYLRISAHSSVRGHSQFPAMPPPGGYTVTVAWYPVSATARLTISG